MLHNLIECAAVNRTLDDVSRVLGSDVRELDSEEALQSTVAVQLALLAAGVSTARSVDGT